MKGVIAQKRKVNTVQPVENFATPGVKYTGAYNPESGCRIAAALAGLGNATDVDFAQALGVSIPTFEMWKRTHREFAKAIETAPDRCDAAVERTLLRCALGFDYKTEKVINTREGPFVRAVNKHYPPNVEALAFILPVRLPQLYGAAAATNIFEQFLRRNTKDAPPSQVTASDETLDDEILRVAYVMSRLLASDSEIAAALGLSLEVFRELRVRHSELAEALNSGKEATDQALERALARRAGGYHYMDEELFCSREGDIKRTQVSRSLPADLMALDLWLRAHPATSEPPPAS